MNEFSLKEIYDVVLKANYPMDINGTSFDEGDVIIKFDKLQLANFNEIRNFVAARGGFDTRPRVTWDELKEVPLTFTQGVFSKTQMAIMNNLKIVSSKENQFEIFTQTEDTQSDEFGKIVLKHTPIGKLRVKDENGEDIDFEVENNIVTIRDIFKSVYISYDFEYTNKMTYLIVGQRFLNGFLTFEGRTRVKDDITGQTHTGIIKIPKLKLMSDLSMRLGQDATPVLGTFKAVGYPVGVKGNKKAMEIILLDDDIDSDL